MKNILLITGASQGIGYAAANIFKQHAWDVINISRKPCDIEGVKNFSVDLSHSDFIKTLEPSLKQFLEKSHKIALIHNASVCYRDTIQNCTVENFQQTLQVNVTAPLQLNQLVLPFMKKGSSIIYVGSTLSEKAVPNNASYIASKHAIAGLMKATCQDLEGSFIHTCCVCPGITDTQMLHERVNHDSNTLQALAKIMSEKRLIEPKEIADVLWFVANHPVINGSLIHAHLGQIER